MIVDELARYAVFETGRTLPPEVADHAKRAVIDWFAALFPGNAAWVGVSAAPQEL